MDDQFSHNLAAVRSHIEGLRQSGLSREAILALLDESALPQKPLEDLSVSQQQHESPPQQQEQQIHEPAQDQSQPPPSSESFSFPLPPQSQPNDPEGSLKPQLQPVAEHAVQPAQRSPVAGSQTRTPGQNDFKPPPHVRASVASTLSTCSSHDSVFTSASARSSVSLTTASPDSKFWCTSCDKTFKRKFDWKRHEEEFHERWRKYPCPNCNQSFWGPNTFNQHHKSAHGCKSCPHSDTVVKYMQRRKAWGCGFCAAMHGKFEKHIDHVAAHFENGAIKNDWLHSNVIYGLLHQHVIHEAWKDLVVNQSSLYPGRQLMFSWSPESTGRAQGYLEKENKGQLQDYLEFFNGTKESADEIVQEAWKCVHVVLRPPKEDLPGISEDENPPLVGNSHKHIPVTSLQPRESRRAASNSAVSIAKRAIKRSASREEFAAHQKLYTPSEVMPTVVVSSPPQQQQFGFPQTHGQLSPHSHQLPQQGSFDTTYQPFFPTPQATPHQDHSRMMSLDKALPPAPMGNLSPLTNPPPMGLQYSLFDDNSQSMMIDTDFTNNSWTNHSPANSIMEDHTMTEPVGQAPNEMYGPSGFPMGWGGSMGQFEPNQ